MKWAKNKINVNNDVSMNPPIEGIDEVISYFFTELLSLETVILSEHYFNSSKEN